MIVSVQRFVCPANCSVVLQYCWFWFLSGRLFNFQQNS